jgi:purine nucleosidase
MASRRMGLGCSVALVALATSCANSDQVPNEIAAEVSEIRVGCEPRTPIIFDSDMDFDDTAALAYLARRHKAGQIELRAVTVTNNGAGFPGQAIRHARCLLAEFGLSHIPVADGSPTAVNSFSPVLRFAISQILGDTFASCTASTASSSVSAAQTIANTISSSSRPVTILATGPLTNVASAFAIMSSSGRPFPLAKVRRTVVMGGAVRVAGNADVGPTSDGTQEINIWADPPAAQAVVSRLTPARLTLIPLDATNHAPVTAAYLARINGDQSTIEAQYVSRLMNHPFIQFGVATGAPLYWWDPVAAIAASSISSEGVVNYEWLRIGVTQTGVQQGRTVELSSGRSFARVGTSANTALFENEFLDGLNGR